MRLSLVHPLRLEQTEGIVGLGWLEVRCDVT